MNKQRIRQHNMALDENYPSEYEWAYLWAALKHDEVMQRTVGNLRLMLDYLRSEHLRQARREANA